MKNKSGTIETWVEIPISYDFTPEQKTTWHEPGYPAQININTIEFEGDEINGKLSNYLYKTYLDSLTEECWQDLEDYHDHARKKVQTQP